MSKMRFGTWAAKDVNDERKINYTFKHDGKVDTFTSDDCVPGITIGMIREARIESIKLVGDEWQVVIYEDEQ